MQLRTSTQTHEDAIDRLCRAREEVVEEWRETRTHDYYQLRGITSLHTDSALYWPMDPGSELEVEFYSEIAERAGVAPPWW